MVLTLLTSVSDSSVKLSTEQSLQAGGVRQSQIVPGGQQSSVGFASYRDRPCVPCCDRSRAGGQGPQGSSHTDRHLAPQPQVPGWNTAHSRHIPYIAHTHTHTHTHIPPSIHTHTAKHNSTHTYTYRQHHLHEHHEHVQHECTCCTHYTGRT